MTHKEDKEKDPDRKFVCTVKCTHKICTYDYFKYTIQWHWIHSQGFKAITSEETPYLLNSDSLFSPVTPNLLYVSVEPYNMWHFCQTSFMLA
jgi:hypothetical protein